MRKHRCLNDTTITENQHGILQNSNNSPLECKAQRSLYGKMICLCVFSSLHPLSQPTQTHFFSSTDFEKKRIVEDIFSAKLSLTTSSAVFIYGWNNSLLQRLNKDCENALLFCPLAVLCLSCALLRFRRQGLGRPIPCLHSQEDTGAKPQS